MSPFFVAMMQAPPLFTISEPFVLLYSSHSKYEPRGVTVWREYLESADLGEEPAQFFTEYLGVPCRLVHKSPNHVRPVVEHAPGVAEIGFTPEV
jgi:uncharacterized protein YcbX